MRLSSIATIAGSFAAAGVVSVVAAYFSAQLVESASRTAVLTELDMEGLTWAEVDTNGLQVFLIGTAPDEATRFQALSAAGRAVDAARVIDNMLVLEGAELTAPDFSVEILRNDAGISVIGLIPAQSDRDALLDTLGGLVGQGTLSDLLETADFEVPDGWEAALRFASGALRDLPRSKISVSADRVAIKAMTESAEAKRRLESDLRRRVPTGVALELDLSAPRPVITPFTLRFVIDEAGARFDACSADTEESRDRILAAAARAGMTGDATCTLGLGVPSRRWADAADLVIGKLAELGQGSVTFSNADISLIAVEGTDEALFDRIVGEIEAGLPQVFALTAVLPKPPEQTAEGPPEFVATLSPEGAVQLRGRLSSEIARQTADSLARAQFGSAEVYTAARVVEGLPRDWPVRTLAGIEVLAMLANGSVTVTPDRIAVTGKTGLQDAQAEITRLLSDKLGEGNEFDIDVIYVEQLDPTLGLPSPEECERRIITVVGDRKITFEPGSATLDSSAKDILDELAELLKTCGEIPLEIGGHTDSQGREVMNEQLSQERAQSVLDALRLRLVPVRSYAVKGYGESQPIADNGTEDGREANRRIEFRLLRPEPVEEGATTLEEVEGAPPGIADAQEGSGDEQN
ncbi:OmpA family protein [Thetidibacter halocola]|uniref:OmpA family protein n=1 Tax=Thetidibacter halocola TaxID=2827239 RepID=A0A8J7WCJ7_9RHOB|nr:OmpA family protein [Thetidibacter halocola]MBS0125125.1 OmpA family protein [Thetidibacter halocola]